MPVGGGFVSVDFRNHCTGLAHLPGVIRCQSERLPAALASGASGEGAGTASDPEAGADAAGAEASGGFDGDGVAATAGVATAGGADLATGLAGGSSRAGCSGGSSCTLTTWTGGGGAICGGGAVIAGGVTGAAGAGGTGRATSTTALVRGVGEAGRTVLGGAVGAVAVALVATAVPGLVPELVRGVSHWRIHSCSRALWGAAGLAANHCRYWAAAERRSPWS